MINEDMNSLMERYKKQLMEFERRNAEAQKADGSAAQTVRTDGDDGKNEPAAATAGTAAADTAVEAAETGGRTDLGDAPVPDMEINRPQELDAPELPQPKTVFRRPQTLEAGTSLLSENTGISEQKYNEYKSELNKTGFLRVETYASNGIYPVSNSRVVVYKPIDGVNYYIYDAMTDSSGILDGLELPAPDKSLSLRPDNSGVVPYATYNIYVDHPDFVKTYIENVPVFDGIVSIQAVEMLPVVENATEPTTVRVLEREPSL